MQYTILNAIETETTQRHRHIPSPGIPNHTAFYTELVNMAMLMHSIYAFVYKRNNAAVPVGSSRSAS